MLTKIEYPSLSAVLAAKLVIHGRHVRSSWNKGVMQYALELLPAIQSKANEFERKPRSCSEVRRWALNGAAGWWAYSEGGCSLIRDSDIAERLCTPSELKRKRGGELAPNSRESWLDVQGRALHQACNLISGICRSDGLYYEEGGANRE